MVYCFICFEMCGSTTCLWCCSVTVKHALMVIVLMKTERYQRAACAWPYSCILLVICASKLYWEQMGQT